MTIARAFWFSLGLVSLVMGIIGAVLPVMPTVPFLLLSAIGFSKSSKRIHDWLINHRYFGPPIRDWERNQTIRRPMKVWAAVAMAGSIALTLLLSVPLVFVLIQAAILLAVLVFIGTRPES